jgi:uncharacterized SAM-binding protein YcdF (DUF218 family)
MSRQRRARRSSPIAPSLCTFPTLVAATVGFLCMIVFFFSTTSSSSSKLSRNQHHQQHDYPRLFYDPSEIPSSLLRSFDVVVILGGGVPISVTHPPKYVERRCDDAIQVAQRYYKEVTTITSSPLSRLPLLCLSAGTAHLPQLLSADGLPIWESTACAGYILDQNSDGLLSNIDPKDIYVETTSYDTIGNAFYTRTTHTDITGWRNLLIITNEFHMDRTRMIFDWIFSLPLSVTQPQQQIITTQKRTTTTSTTNKIQPQQRNNNNISNGTDQQDGGTSSSSPQRGYNLYYLQSPNIGLTEDAIVARKEKEGLSIKTLQNTILPMYGTSLYDVYTFLTQHHALYTSQKLIDRGGHTRNRNAGDGNDSNTGGGGTAAAAVSAMVRQSYGATV